MTKKGSFLKLGAGLPGKIQRYLRFLPRYTLRQRKKFAARWLEKICASNWTIVELGCGNRSLASRVGNSRYIGVEQSGAELTNSEIPAGDLVVFLGVVDKLKKDEFSLLLNRIRSKRILFSFTETTKRAARRDRAYSTDTVAALLEQHGFKKTEVRRCRWMDSGRVVFAEKHSRPAAH